MIRGIERRFIFIDDLDREDLAHRLTRVFVESNARCWAWAFMDNHAHWIVQTDAVGISRLMARILTGYARRFNQRHERVGYLFQSRFKSRLILDDADLVGVVRYVHLNPLSARIVGTLEELERYRWTGHGAVVGVIPPQHFHAAHATRELFGSAPEACERWRKWLREGTERPLSPADPEEPMEDRRHDEPIPSTVPDSLAPWVDRVCRHFIVSPRVLLEVRGTRNASWARAVLAHIAVDRLGLPVRAVAAHLGASPSALSRAARRGWEIARTHGLLLDDPPRAQGECNLRPRSRGSQRGSPPSW
jgi:REP element-mobilizing transposase RayT